MVTATMEGLSSGIMTVPSHQSVERTVQKIEELLKAKGVKLFAVIDHSGEAHLAGLSLRPTKLLIFGSAKAGTPVMAASPMSAIDLPLKLLVWQDDAGGTQISFNRTSYIQSRHGLPQELAQRISLVEWLAAAAAE